MGVRGWAVIPLEGDRPVHEVDDYVRPRDDGVVVDGGVEDQATSNDSVIRRHGIERDRVRHSN